MISLEEIEEKLKELKEMMGEYNKQDVLRWNKDWKPNINDEYYYINSINDVSFSINNTVFDKIRIEHNRIFKIREQAQKWLEIDTYLKGKSFEPDWNDSNQLKWSLNYSFCDKRFCFDYCYLQYDFKKFYFETEEIVEEIFKKYTTEELEFYFNIGG